MTDQKTVQLVVRLLGAIALAGVVGILLLIVVAMLSDTPLRDVALVVTPVVSITSAAAGALGAVLASTRTVDPEQVAHEAEVNLTAGLQELAAGGGPDPAPPAGD